MASDGPHFMASTYVLVCTPRHHFMASHRPHSWPHGVITIGCVHIVAPSERLCQTRRPVVAQWLRARQPFYGDSYNDRLMSASKANTPVQGSHSDSRQPFLVAWLRIRRPRYDDRMDVCI
eukprot:833442-Pelagomonas_calceolata.AAC.2